MQGFTYDAVQVQLYGFLQWSEHWLRFVVLVHPSLESELFTSHTHNTDLNLLLVFKPASNTLKHPENVVFILVTDQKLKHFIVLQEVKSLELDSFLFEKIAQVLKNWIKILYVVKEHGFGLFVETLCGLYKPSDIFHGFL